MVFCLYSIHNLFDPGSGVVVEILDGSAVFYSGQLSSLGPGIGGVSSGKHITDGIISHSNSIPVQKLILPYRIIGTCLCSDCFCRKCLCFCKVIGLHFHKVSSQIIPIGQRLVQRMVILTDQLVPLIIQEGAPAGSILDVGDISIGIIGIFQCFISIFDCLGKAVPIISIIEIGIPCLKRFDRTPGMRSHSSQRIIFGGSCKRGGTFGFQFLSILVIGVGSSNTSGLTTVEESGHVVVHIIGIFIGISLFIPHTHQTSQKIVIHLINFTGHVICHLNQISLSVIYILMKLLFRLRFCLLIVSQRCTILCVIGVTDGTSVSVKESGQASIVAFILIADHLSACH